MAAGFEQIRSLFEQTMRMRVDSGKPFIVLAVKNEKTMRDLIPESWKQKGLAHPAGSIFTDWDKQYVAVRLDTGGDFPFHAIYHEYTHMVLDLNIRSMPLWMSEGLAEFYGHTVLGDGKVGLGDLDPGAIRRLRSARLIPLSELFRADEDSPYYREEDKAPVFYAESWALTHYLILGEELPPGQRNRMSAFLEFLQKDVGEEEAARQAFGDLGTLQQALQAYIDKMRFPYLEVETHAAAAPEGFDTRPLPWPETVALVGDFYLHSGRATEARPLLEEALRLQPGLPAAQESLGVFYYQEGDPSQAARWFERAVSGGSGSFLAYFCDAMFRMTSVLTPEALRRVESELNRSIELNPLFGRARALLARVYLDEAKLEQALESAKRAVGLEPWLVANQVVLGNALVRMGRYDEARELVGSMKRAAVSAVDKRAVSDFISYLDRVQNGKR